MEESAMMGKPKRRAAKLFITGFDLEDRVPADHPLRRIKRVIDFDAVRREVGRCYGRNGHESLDPALTMKLMFLAFYENVRSERELMRQLPLRLDWLWFCEMDVDERAPDHSVLSKARRQWGLEVFERLFEQVLQQCVDAGLADGATLHADSTLLKANASLESRISRQLWNQLESGLSASTTPQTRGRHEDDDPHNGPNPRGNHDICGPPPRTPAPPEDTQAHELPDPPKGKFNQATVSRTDPDAATTRRRGHGVTLGYRDHRLVDDRSGIIVNTTATAADYDDAAMLQPMLDQVRQSTNLTPTRVTGDSAYGTHANCAALQARGIRAYLKRRRGRPSTQHQPIDHLPGYAARHWLRRRLTVAEGSFATSHVRYDHRRCRWRSRRAGTGVCRSSAT
jgi:transposase